ncbi:uncharacterized protein LOC124259276 [Haliotis rubra]|uniref:uncharacterized protein LOC124259276 n=1 Tax=Haliotis rubra TaxID=36100 RepID=UPI001EE56CD9|nr:uncharacterized protein LOC124259276 [Haliotis rubra]
MKHQSFADDAQLIDSFHPSNISQALDRTTACTSDIKAWMTGRKLKLNDDKTEAILIGSKRQLQSVDEAYLSIGQAEIYFSDEVKSLGVYLDSQLTMEKQVDSLCRTCYFHLRCIRQIRHLLTTETTKILVQSLVLSRLDYANSLLFGIKKSLLQRLQKVQNTAARMVSRVSKFSPITPVLQSLHWLPVEARLCLTYKCYHGLTPSYLSCLLNHHQSQRSLRSDNLHLLSIPQYNFSRFGDKSFCVHAPRL